jgi:uncharacterized protein with HEPN domain
MSKRNVNLYLVDIREAISKILKYTQNISYNDFCRDSKTMDAVIRNLEIIGEAANNLPLRMRDSADIPWNQMIGMRNKVIHEYFGIDPEILWQTAKEDIPALKKKIKDLV